MSHVRAEEGPWISRAQCALLGVLGICISLLLAELGLKGQILFLEEYLQVFQSSALLDGELGRESAPFSEFMQRPGLLLRGGEQYSVLAPGGAFWLAPGLSVGYPRLMSALACGLGMMLAFRIGRRLRMPRFLFPLLLLLSPMYLLLNASLLPQSLGLCLTLALLDGWIAWRQEGRSLSALGAGLAWLLLFWARPWQALWMGLAFVVDALLQLMRNPKDLRQFRGLSLLALCVVLAFAGQRAWNKQITGSSTRGAMELYEPSELPGFGERRTQGGDVQPVDHTLKRGTWLMFRDLRRMSRWMLDGSSWSLWLGFLLVAHGWSRKWSALWLGGFFSLFLGMAAYWYRAPPWMGPQEVAEALPLILLSISFGLSRIWRKIKHLLLRILIFLPSLAFLCISGWSFLQLQLREMQTKIEQHQLAGDALASLPDQSLLFVEAAHLDLGWGWNIEGLDSPVLQLPVEKQIRVEVAASFPERQAWVLQNPHTGRMLELQGEFQGLQRSAANSHHSRETGENDGEQRVVRPGDPAGFLFYGWYPWLPAGEYECRFRLRWSNVEAAQALRLELMSDEGRTQLAALQLDEGLENTVLRFRLEEPARVEPRVWYGGSGNVSLKDVEILPVSASAE